MHPTLLLLANKDPNDILRDGTGDAFLLKLHHQWSSPMRWFQLHFARPQSLSFIRSSFTVCLGGRATQMQTLDALRDDRPLEEMEEEEAWKALREGQAVRIAFSLFGFGFI